MSAPKITEARSRKTRVKGTTCAHCGAHNRYGREDTTCPFCRDPRLTRDQKIALKWLDILGERIFPLMEIPSFEHTRLVEKGLAETERLDRNYRIFITDAGRAALRGYVDVDVEGYMQRVGR